MTRHGIRPRQARFRTFPRKGADRSDQPTGGARRDRTDDLMLAKHALSQLSYGPEGGDTQKPDAGSSSLPGPASAPKLALQSLVGLGGLEPPTSRLSSARSNQLSYKPAARGMTPREGRVRKERETKTALFRNARCMSVRPDILRLNFPSPKREGTPPRSRTIEDCG